MNETELLQAFREKRSESAFTELVRRYAGLVYSVAKRRVTNPTLAEDITQLVFIRLAKTPPPAKSPGELAAWLHRITVNVTIDTWRSESRRRNREQQATLMETVLPDNNAWEELAPDLDNALDQLTTDDRETLLLRFFQQKTMRDVGTALGISEDAAKMRVSRAIDRLRSQLNLRTATLSVTVLGTLLAERSVEAVPHQLLSRLAAIKLLPSPGLVPQSIVPWAIGAAALVFVGTAAFHFSHRSHAAISPAPSNAANNATASVPPETRSVSTRSFQPPPASSMTTKVKIQFHVLDSETGNGLANAKVHAAYFGVGGVGEGHDVLTDTNGDAAVPQPDDPTKLWSHKRPRAGRRRRDWH